MKKYVRRFFKWLSFTVAIFIISIAVAINIARAIVPLINHKRDFLEKWVGRTLHRPVKIGRVSVGWYGLNPTLKFNNVIILDSKNKQTLLHIKKLAIGVDLAHSLINRRLLPDRLYIFGTTLNIFQSRSGKIALKGLVNFNGQHKQTNSYDLKRLLAWTLTQANILIKDVNINFHSNTGKLFRINNIKLKVRNSLLHHQIAGIASLAQKKPTQFHFVLSFKNTDLNSKNFGANFYFYIKDLSLQQWKENDYLRKYFTRIQIPQGQVNLQTWLKWRKGRLQQVQGLIEGKDVVLRLIRKSKNIAINKLHANVMWQRFDDGWAISADHVQLVAEGKQWSEHQFGFRAMNDGTNVLFVDHLPLHDVQTLATKTGYWSDILARRYSALKPTGELYHLLLSYSHPRNKTSNYHLITHFKNIKFSSWQKLPKLSGLNGFIDVTPTQGRVKLNSQKAQVAIPWLFSQPFLLQTLDMAATWQRVNSAWNIDVTQLVLNDGTAGVKGKFKLSLPKTQSPVIDLSARFYLATTRQLSKYLPSRVMTSHLSTWFKRALPSGKVTDGKVMFRGLLNHPLMADNQFKVSAQMHNVTLKYHRNWPAINQIQGKLVFDRGGLHIDADHAVTLDNPLDHIKAEIPNFKQAILAVAGHSSTDLHDLTNFLRHTPLRVGKQLQGLDFRGPTNVDLTLSIPLNVKGRKGKVAGRGIIKQGSFGLNNWRTRITHIAGEFHVANSSLEAQKLTAQYLGFPLTIQVSTLTDQKTKTPILQCKMNGKISMAALQTRFSLPALNYFNGAAAYSGVLRLRDDNSSQIGTLQLSSDLKGISAELPSFFGKSGDQKRLFSLSIGMFTREPLRIKLHYGENFSAALKLDKKNERYHLLAGEMHVGKEEAHFQTLPGLLVTGKLKQLDWMEWRKYIASKPSADQPTVVRDIDLQIGALKVFNQTLNNTHLNLTPKKGGWSIAIKNPDIVGNLYIPNRHSDTWHAYFTHLTLPKMSKSVAQQQDPKKLPSIDFVCDDCRYSNRVLGRVALRTTAVAAGLKIDNLEIKNPLFSISAVGTWLQKQNGQQSSLFGHFTTTNLSFVMRNWDITQVLEGGRGMANFALDWPGAPHQFKTANLSGDVKINFHDGRVIQVSEGAAAGLGVGRLLNLFSLQSLPRLPLKLAHLTKKGFVFTLFKGDFNLTHGNAKTTNAALVGPVAWVQMNGDIGFAKKNYDLHLKVIPNVTSMLPLIAGIVAGPLAGAITWVANKVLAPQVGKMAQFNYQVTGTWNEPSILTLPQPAETGTY